MQVDRFFDAYAQASDTLDSGALAGLFAEVLSRRRRDRCPGQGLQTLPQRAQMLADAGSGWATPGSVTWQQPGEHYVPAPNGPRRGSAG